MIKHAGDEINPEEPADPNGSKQLKTDRSEEAASSKPELPRSKSLSRLLSKREYHSRLPQQSENQPESKKKSSTHILREASHKSLTDGVEAKPHSKKAIDNHTHIAKSKHAKSFGLRKNIKPPRPEKNSRLRSTLHIREASSDELALIRKQDLAKLRKQSSAAEEEKVLVVQDGAKGSCFAIELRLTDFSKIEASSRQSDQRNQKKGESSLAIIRQLQKVRHPSLLPIRQIRKGSGKARYFQVLSFGSPLSKLLDEQSEPSLDYWKDQFKGNTDQLIRSFIHLLRLCSQLQRKEIPLRCCSADRIQFAPTGELFVEARDLIKPLGTIPSLQQELLLAPEHIMGEEDIDNPPASAAVYQLAALLYAMLFGKPPYPARNQAELLDRIYDLHLRYKQSKSSEYYVSTLFPPQFVWPHQLPIKLKELLCQCLHIDPTQRCGNFRFLSDQLSDCLDTPPLETDTRSTKLLWNARKFWRQLKGWNFPRLGSHYKATLALIVLMVVFSQYYSWRSNTQIPSNQIAALQAELAHLVIWIPKTMEANAPTTVSKNLDSISIGESQWQKNTELAFYQAWLLARTGELNKAQHCFTQLIEKSPREFAYQIGLQIVLLEQCGDQQQKNALLMGLKSLAHSKPTSPIQELSLAAAFLYLDDLASAQKSLQEAVKAHPNEALNWAHLAWCYKIQNRKEKALQALIRAHELGLECSY